MPHIRSLMTQAYARLIAMKLYAYRALDYVASASESDRRYLLFCAVQKAKVSTEGVKVMSLLSECINAKGFESDTYFEMALRDIQLFPGLESSTHINLTLTAQFIPQYFSALPSTIPAPTSLSDNNAAPKENPYLMQAKTGAIHTIPFPDFLASYQPLLHIPNVLLFTNQAKSLAAFFLSPSTQPMLSGPADIAIDIAKCSAIIAYAQLIAERCIPLSPNLTSIIFSHLVTDLSAALLALASSPHLDPHCKLLLHRAIEIPQTTSEALIEVSDRMSTLP